MVKTKKNKNRFWEQKEEKIEKQVQNQQTF